MDLKELESGVDPWTHWYYQSKKLPLLSFIVHLIKKNTKLNIIDIGAGSGFFSEVLQAKFKEQIDHIYLVDTGYTPQEMELSSTQVFIKQHRLPDEMQGSVFILMDVLEHLPDDLQMLKSIKEKAGHDGAFFITVPAFKSIWSGHDIFLGHYRRYTRKSLLEVLARAGFKTERCYYLYGTLFPLVFIKRQLNNLLNSSKQAQSDMKPLPSWLNNMLLKYSTLEMLVTKYNLFFGLSCVAEGRC